MRRCIKKSNISIFLLCMIILTVLNSFAISSCDNSIQKNDINNETSEDITNKVNKKYGYVRFTIDQNNCNERNNRSILPSIKTENISSITLNGQYNGETIVIADNISYSAFTSQNFLLDPGYWDLSITAINDGFDFNSNTATVYISEGSYTNASFTLSAVSSNGAFTIPVQLHGTAAAVDYKLETYPTGPRVDSGSLTITSNTVNYTNNSISPGTYRVLLTFYGDTANKIPLNYYTEIITVKAGFKSRHSGGTRQIDLNQMYSITWDKNDGTLDTSDPLKHLPESYSIFSTINDTEIASVTKEGYDFDNWYTGENGTGTVFAGINPGTSGNKTYHANFSLVNYLINYIFNDDSTNPATNNTNNPLTYTIEDSITFAAPTREHYTFKGWYLKDGSSDGIWQNEIEEITSETGVKTLYAKWEENLNPEIPSGVPQTYICSWGVNVQGTNNTIIISITDKDGHPIEPETVNVSIYEGSDCLGTSDSLNFTYPSYLGSPSGRPFYVQITVKEDASTTYSYDFWPDEKAYINSTSDNTTVPTVSTNTSVSGSSVLNGRNITIPRLIASDHEVTQKEYQMYCKFGLDLGRAPDSGETQAEPQTGYGKGNNYPAYYVSWYDALIYCNRRSIAEGLTPCYSINGETNPANWPDIIGNASEKYCAPAERNELWDDAYFNLDANGWRLPTEIEWEYLARSGNLSSMGTTYSGNNSITAVATYNTTSCTTIKSHSPNDLGLYDMSGNVWEWCWDWYGTITASTPYTGPVTPNSGQERHFRGGSYTNSSSNCTVYYRGGFQPPYLRFRDIGLRVVRNAE